MAIQSNFPAIKPSLMLDFANTKTLDPRITFTRASTATYYDGVTTAKAEENLFTYSQEFDNAAWAKASTSVTANAAVAPDGTTTAELVYPSSTGTYRLIQQNFAANASLSILTTTASKTISFFAKASGFSWVFTADSSSGLKKCFFDLTNGITGTTAANHTTAITSVGNGWYRCVVTTSEQYTGTIIIAVADADNSVTATASGTNGIYLWGAQLEQRSAATAYTATTTQAITNYIPKLQSAASGVARFDNNPTTGESLGLLIEEQRTNLAVRSEELDNAAWTKNGTTVSANTIIAPDGTLTSDKLIATTSNAVHLAQVTAVTASGSHTMSVYAKAGEYTRVAIRESNVTGFGALFDLSAGTVITTNSATATITPVGNGWYRCTATITWGTSYSMGIVVCNNSATTIFPSFAGDGWSGVFVWGAQLEAGTFATSYIPTVASQVTRSADAASMTGTNFSSWYSAGEGTLYVEAALYALPTQDTIFFRMYSSANEDIQIYYSTPGFTRLYIQDNASTVVNIVSSSSTVQANTFLKQAAAFKTNDAAFSVNGALIGTDSVFTMPDANTMSVGSRAMYVRKATYYPLRVTNAQLQALTS